MPKSYSEQEREYIRKRLKEEAADCLARYGVRRTTVDELVKRVNIPKGTFYLFYKSKELLLFEDRQPPVVSVRFRHGGGTPYRGETDGCGFFVL